MQTPKLRIRDVQARPVVAPLPTPLRTASGSITEAPLLLIDLATENCIYVSPAVRMLLGREPVELIGRPLTDFVHTDDAAGAFVAAAEAGRGGLWHVVDDSPTTATDFLTDFARRLGAPQPRRVPAWLVRWLR